MMQAQTENVIGKAFLEARLRGGHKSRLAFVKTKGLAGKITDEGLRKIEYGERIPRLETIRLLGEKLGLSERRIRQLEKEAVKTNVERVTKQTGNASVVVQINDEPIKVTRLPPHTKVEAVVRDLVNDLVKRAEKYGILEEDAADFRVYARNAILKRLDR